MIPFKSHWNKLKNQYNLKIPRLFYFPPLDAFIFPRLVALEADDASRDVGVLLGPGAHEVLDQCPRPRLERELRLEGLQVLGHLGLQVVTKVEQSA